MRLSSQRASDFERDGYLLLPRLFTAAEVATLRAETDRLSAVEADCIKREKSGAVGSILRVHESDGPTRSASLRALTRTHRLMEPVLQLLGDSEVYIYHTKVNFKAALEGGIYSWHQDYGTWRRDGIPAPCPVTAAVMLDDVEEISGALYFAPGSHRHGEVIHLEDPGIGALNPLSVDRRHLTRLLEARKPVPIVAPAGSVVLFHSTLIHGSGYKMSPRDRRQIYIVYNPVANKPLPVEQRAPTSSARATPHRLPWGATKTFCWPWKAWSTDRLIGDTMLKHRLLHFLWVCASIAVSGITPLAQADYADHPIKLVNPYPAGAGAMDVAARVMSEKLAARLGSPVIVVFQAGAAGTLAAGAVARGPKDAYTIYFGASSALGYPKLLNKDLAYDPQKDFTPIAMLGTVPVASFVSASSNIRSLQDLIAAAKAKPDGLNFDSPGVGSATHVAMETFMSKAGIQMKHVPYGSQANYWTDLMGGQLQVVTAGITGGLGLVKDGRLRMIATATRDRSQTAPDVPAIGESIPGYDGPAWLGLVVAQGTPEPIVAKLEAAAMEVFSDPQTKAELGRFGIEINPLDRKAFGAKMAADLAVWEAALKVPGLTN